MKQSGQIIRMQNGIAIADYSGENLQGRSFRRANLRQADFTGADLRGADFSYAILSGAKFNHAKLGIQKSSRVFLLFFSLVLSLLSGYVAMLAGSTVHKLVLSGDWRLQGSGYILIGFFILFTAVALWKGLDTAVTKILLTLIGITGALGLIMFVTGYGTGEGALYGLFALLLMAMMFVVGTVARTTIGTLGSTILFVLVAISGGMFGRSVGGGIGTIVMAIACALISKRALKEKGDTLLRKVALTVSTYFGTSFKQANLSGADFSDAEIKNTNFSGANLNGANWVNVKKEFVLED